MAKIIIVGGGWAGCSAAIAARKTGAEVLLIERTDLLLGLGNVGGIMRNNGRFTATEETIAMGAGELFDITDRYSVHRNVDFPGHRHGSFYDPEEVEPAVGRLLQDMGVDVKLPCRITEVHTKNNYIESITSAEGENFEADVFVDCTGTTGPMGNCMEFGNGCSMCVLRCPAFGPRVSISAKAGGVDYCGIRDDGTPGAFSGSCKLDRNSLSKELQQRLDEEGVAIIPLPKEMIHRGKLEQKVCRQYALPQFAENIILIDTGHVKIMTPFFPLSQLRQLSGFEKARFLDPYAGSKGNSIRYMAIAERNQYLKVKGVENLFCGGEKAGPFIGHTEAIVTGALSGFNAGAMARGEVPLSLPKEGTAVGAFLHYEKPGGVMFTFAGDVFFEYMKEQGLYSTDVSEIRSRIGRAGLSGIYNAFL